MRKFFIKRHVLFMALLLLCTFTSQAENDLTTTQITLNIKSGELQSEVESSGWQWNQITNLKLVGELNVDDLQFIRKMVGCYYNPLAELI